MNRNGYILPLTLMLISMAIVMVTSIIQRSTIFQMQVHRTDDREQARNLALSGIELALSKVSLVLPAERTKKEEGKPQAPKTEEKEEKGAEKKLSNEQKWSLQFLPILNKWQTFELTDPLAGTISFHISCEQGKLDLVYLSSFLDGKGEKKEQGQQKEEKESSPNSEEEKKEASQKLGVSEKKGVLEGLDGLIKKVTDIPLIQMIKEMKEKFKGSLEDVTQLILLKSLSSVKNTLFVAKPKDQKAIRQGKAPVALTDLFTAHADSGKLNPWVLSSSTRDALGFKENREVKFNEQFVKGLKKDDAMANGVG